MLSGISTFISFSCYPASNLLLLSSLKFCLSEIKSQATSEEARMQTVVRFLRPLYMACLRRLGYLQALRYRKRRGNQ